MSNFLVIGAGVNGLACAVELARAGNKVTVVERRKAIGGLSGRRAFGEGFEVPGIRHDTCEIRPSLATSLGLDLAMRTEPAPVFASDAKDGLVLHVAPEAASEELNRRSTKDAAAYAELRGLLSRLKPILTQVLDAAPPPLLPSGAGEMLGMGLTGLKLRGLGRRDMTEFLRAAPMCVADWMRELFETELLSATLAFPAVAGDFVGPWSPGTAAMLILREAMLVPGVAGGPAAVVDALAKSAGAAGVAIRTGTRVTKIRLGAGRATGVVLDGGEEIAADAIVAACNPKHAIGELLPPLTLTTRDQTSARTMRTRGTAAKVHLGLRGEPAWRGRPGAKFERVRAGGAHLDDLERAFDAAKYRRLPERPVLDVALSTSASGKRALSILVMAVPHDLEGGWTAEAKKSLLKSVLERLDDAAPGVRDLIQSDEVLSPVDIESEFGTPGGSIHHVERALDQMIFMRPARPFARFHTPVEGLFVGSSGCHPGPGVTLAPGVLAARAVLGT